MGSTFWLVITLVAISMALGGGAVVAAHFHVTWAVALLVLLTIASGMVAGFARGVLREDIGRGR